MTYTKKQEAEARKLWRNFVTSGAKAANPDFNNIPDNPSVVYANAGWAGWCDWIGGYRVKESLKVQTADERKRSKAEKRKAERHIDDILPDKNVTIGSNDDGSFFAPDGVLWFPAKRKNYYFRAGKAKGWKPCSKS